MKLVNAVAAKDFSSTLFGNVSRGDKLTISEERYRSWSSHGLVSKVTVDLSAMKKDDLIDYAKKHFQIDLDKRRKAEALREDVQALIEAL